MSNSQTILDNNNRINAVAEVLRNKAGGATIDPHPVDTIYITTSESVRPAEMFGGTWELLPEGYALWTTTTNGHGGTIIGAGLPNITGTFQGGAKANTKTSGAFIKDSTNSNGYGGSGTYFCDYSFDASASNSLYGMSNTVQPPAYCVFVWRRTD